MERVAETVIIPPRQRRVVEVAIVGTALLLALLAINYQEFMLLAFCAPLLLLAILKFDFYIQAVILLLPWYPFLGWKLPIRDAFLMVHFVLFAGACVFQHRKQVSWRDWLWHGWLRRGIIAFAGIAVLSLLLSESRDAEGAAKALAKLLSYTAVFLSISAWAVTREKINRIVRILLISTIIVCLFGLYQAHVQDFTAFYFQMYPDIEKVFLDGGGWMGRITSFLFHYNSLAGYLNAVIPLALATTVLAQTRGTRRLGFVCLFLSCAALYLTGSRGGMIAFGAVVGFSLLSLKPRVRTAAVLAAALFGATCVVQLVSPPKPESHGERLQTIDDFTVESRLALWGAAGLLFAEHPVAGAGFGTYRFALQTYVPGATDQIDAHNLYLQTLAETGVIGFLVFFITLGAFWRRSFALMKMKVSDPHGQIIGFAVCAAIGATLVHGAVDYIFITSPQFGNLFWLLLALSLAAIECAQRQQPAFSMEAF